MFLYILIKLYCFSKLDKANVVNNSIGSGFEVFMAGDFGDKISPLIRLRLVLAIDFTICPEGYFFKEIFWYYKSLTARMGKILNNYIQSTEKCIDRTFLVYCVWSNEV